MRKMRKGSEYLGKRTLLQRLKGKKMNACKKGEINSWLRGEVEI